MNEFRFIVDNVGYGIEKKDTLRESIRSDERVAVTLRYLATGETFKSLEYAFRIRRMCIDSRGDLRSHLCYFGAYIF